MIGMPQNHWRGKTHPRCAQLPSLSPCDLQPGPNRQADNPTLGCFRQEPSAFLSRQAPVFPSQTKWWLLRVLRLPSGWTEEPLVSLALQHEDRNQGRVQLSPLIYGLPAYKPSTSVFIRHRDAGKAGDLEKTEDLAGSIALLLLWPRMWRRAWSTL